MRHRQCSQLGFTNTVSLGSDASARSSARRPHRPQFFDGIKVYVRLHTSIAIRIRLHLHILIFIKCREVVFVIFEE